MVTTFFGSQATGGDATYVDRLSRALLRRGHEVDVIHCADAFATAAGGFPEQSYDPPSGLTVHRLKSRVGAVSPVWTHLTGGPGPKGPKLHRLLRRGRYDVVHLHNVSLIGGAGAVAAATQVPAVRLMTLHDHWLVCPLSLRWKMDREPCDRPQCIRCTINARRPPQLWRATGRLRRAVAGVDALIAPSASARRLHRERGIDAPIVELGHLLPEDWAGAAVSGSRADRPYLVAAGRLVREKGFEDLMRLMPRMPDIDLRVAGSGPLEPSLRRLAAPLPNVTLTGRLKPPDFGRLLAGSLALVAPSLFPETYGYVVLEAASMGTPAIVRRRGALPEVVDRIGAGLVFDRDDEAIAMVRGLASDPALRRHLGESARAGARREGSEQRHVRRYLDLVASCAVRRGA